MTGERPPLARRIAGEIAALPANLPKAIVAAGAVFLVVWVLGSLVGIFAAGIAAGYVLGRK